MKLTVEQAEAIVRLLQIPEFRTFMDLIGERGEKSMYALINSPKGLKVKQGQCQAYTEIVDDVTAAKKTLEDYQNSK